MFTLPHVRGSSMAKRVIRGFVTKGNRQRAWKQPLAAANTVQIMQAYCVDLLCEAVQHLMNET